MTSSTRFDPMKELTNLRDQVAKVFDDALAPNSTNLPIDIYETDEALFVLTGPLVGLDTASLDISITEGQNLTVAGETKMPAELGEVNFLRRERRFGPFSRSLVLPIAVIAEEAKASYRDNVVKITLPKAEKSGPRVIKVTPID